MAPAWFAGAFLSRVFSVTHREVRGLATATPDIGATSLVH